MRLSQHTPVGHAFAARLDLHAVPSLVVYNEVGEEQQRFVGSIPNPQALAAALKQA